MNEVGNSKQLEEVIEYYDHTRYDYRTAWDDSENPAVHFGFYDEYADKHSDSLQNTNRTLAEFAEIRKGEAVLDAGCGRGGSCFWLVKNKQAIPTGITPVQSQVEDCIDKAKELGLADQVNFVNADYCNTPFEDQSFDVIWACESLCHASEKADFYREAFRLLRPGGRLIVAEYLRSTRPLPPKGEDLLAAWLRSWAIPDIDTQSEHERYANAAGFQKFEVVDYTSKVRVSLRNLHEKSSRLKLVSRLLTAFTKRTKVQHQNLIGSIRQYEALQGEYWKYCLLVGRKN